jgi:hypothetical protein
MGLRSIVFYSFRCNPVEIRTGKYVAVFFITNLSKSFSSTWENGGDIFQQLFFIWPSSSLKWGSNEQPARAGLFTCYPYLYTGWQDWHEYFIR